MPCQFSWPYTHYFTQTKNKEKILNKLIVFTGGPGAGKTSVIEQLKIQGFICAPETGRHVIQTQVANHGSALPWNDKQAFRDEMTKEEVSNYRSFNVLQGDVFLIAVLWTYMATASWNNCQSRMSSSRIARRFVIILKYSFFHRGHRYSVTMKSENKIFLKRSPRINRWSMHTTSSVIN